MWSCVVSLLDMLELLDMPCGIVLPRPIRSAVLLMLYSISCMRCSPSLLYRYSVRDTCKLGAVLYSGIVGHRGPRTRAPSLPPCPQHVRYSTVMLHAAAQLLACGCSSWSLGESWETPHCTAWAPTRARGLLKGANLSCTAVRGLSTTEPPRYFRTYEALHPSVSSAAVPISGPAGLLSPRTVRWLSKAAQYVCSSSTLDEDPPCWRRGECATRPVVPRRGCMEGASQLYVPNCTSVRPGRTVLCCTVR